MKIKISLFALMFTFTSCALLKDLNLQPSMFETISALKEVLNSSTFRAIKFLSTMSNNPEDSLPSEVKPVLAGLKALGMGNEINKISGQIGAASKLTLNESSGIIKDAITELDFGDAVAVVTGGEDAATVVLKSAMKAAVKKRYSERLNVELNKTDANKYWPMAAASYNLLSKNKVDSNLSDFLAERAVDGIFLAMGKEEKEIRKNPSQLGSAVVTKVFNYYKNKQGTTTSPKIQFKNI